MCLGFLASTYYRDCVFVEFAFVAIVIDSSHLRLQHVTEVNIVTADAGNQQFGSGSRESSWQRNTAKGGTLQASKLIAEPLRMQMLR